MSDRNLLCHIKRYKGETVTIFTTSGGASGCGFTGVLMDVNPCFVRLMTRQGSPPANPFGQDTFPANGVGDYQHFKLGSVCDIPTCKIASFAHNAI